MVHHRLRTKGLFKIKETVPQFTYLDVLVDNVLACKPILLVDVPGVAEYAVACVEVVIGPSYNRKYHTI